LQGDLTVIRFFNPKWLGRLIAFPFQHSAYDFLWGFSCFFSLYFL